MKEGSSQSWPACSVRGSEVCAEHVAVDQRGLLRITWNMCVHRSIKSVLSNTESEGSRSRSPGSSAWACFNPCCNTISVLKVSAAAGSAQVHRVAAPVHLICWQIEPAPYIWASQPLGLASTKLTLKRSNWQKELGKYCIHLH